jgi:hypothetical protein
MMVQDLKLLIENLPDNMPVSVMGSDVQNAVVLDNMLILDGNPDSFYAAEGFVLYQAQPQGYTHTRGRT